MKALGAGGLALFLMLSSAMAHEWYGKRVDPTTGSQCCGGKECGELDGRLIIPDTYGYRITLTLAQARKINVETTSGIDAVIPWSRIQQSEDGGFHICILTNDRTPPEYGIQCFFAPPNS